MNGYISIRQILDDLLEHPLMRDLSLERAVAYAVKFIQIVGMPRIFEEKTATLEIKDFRVALPADYYQVLQVREHNSGCTFMYSSDNFHMNNDNVSLARTYKIQGAVLYTSMKEGEIDIAYQAMVLDDEGYPMIPDNSSFIEALELYIKKKWFTIQFESGKITAPVLQNIQQEYAWAVGQAQSDLVRPTIDQMETFTRMWNTLIPTNSHKRGFGSVKIKV